MSTFSPTSHISDPVLLRPASPSQTRKRPLRTYSRKPAHAKVQEPGSSRSEKHGAAAADSSRAPSTPQLPVPPPQKGTVQLNRGSILAFFKPLSPRPDAAPSRVASSDPAEPPTPPSSPKAPPRPRKRRRLTTRPQLSGLDQLPKNGAGDYVLDQDGFLEEPSVSAPCSPAASETTIYVKTEAPGMLRPALGEAAANTLHQPTQLVRPLAEGRTGGKSRPAKRGARDMTQTTLSLSVHKEPGFTICSVCDILYNPLNEKDRKEHNRRHAAHSRAKRRWYE